MPRPILSMLHKFMFKLVIAHGVTFQRVAFRMIRWITSQPLINPNYLIPLVSLLGQGMISCGSIPHLMRSQVPCWTQAGSKSIEQWNCLKLKTQAHLSTLKGVEGHADAPGWD